MLLAVDARFGREVEGLVAALGRAFRPSVRAFEAPLEPPDAGLGAALAVGPLAVLLAPAPTPWLAALPVRQIWLGNDDDPVAAVGHGLGLRQATGAVAPPPRMAPLDGAALAGGLAAIGDLWGIEVATGGGLAGLKVELVARFRRSNYVEAAAFCRAVAALAEAQNHHPTLIHDWRTVTVRVATGEAGGRLTERDLRFAAAVDRLAAGSGDAG